MLLRNTLWCRVGCPGPARRCQPPTVPPLPCVPRLSSPTWAPRCTPARPSPTRPLKTSGGASSSPTSSTRWAPSSWPSAACAALPSSCPPLPPACTGARSTSEGSWPPRGAAARLPSPHCKSSRSSLRWGLAGRGVRRDAPVPTVVGCAGGALGCSVGALLQPRPCPCLGSGGLTGGGAAGARLGSQQVPWGPWGPVPPWCSWPCQKDAGVGTVPGKLCLQNKGVGAASDPVSVLPPGMSPCAGGPRTVPAPRVIGRGPAGSPGAGGLGGAA